MADATAHARVVLAAILPNRRDLLEKAEVQLQEEHFTDAPFRTIFKAMLRYKETAGGVLTEQALIDMLETDPGKEAYYREVFQGLMEFSADETDFKWSIHQLREIATTKATEQAIVAAHEILRGQHEEEEEGETLEGHAAARQFLSDALSLIERDTSLNDSPEGDMREEVREMILDYKERKEARLAGKARGIEFGIPDLDHLVGGVQRGEMALIAAYSGVGKTNFCVNFAWEAAVMQGKNVVILSTETTRDQIRRNLLARHSRHPKFALREGLDSALIRAGDLGDQEDQFKTILRDLALPDNPYGKLFIKQVPKGASISWVEASLRAISRSFEVDLLIIDYLALLRSDKKRNTDREELNNILKDAKLLATSLNDGKGVPLISPWQVNRSGFAAAESSGYYSSDHLAETSESVNSSDLIISLLQQGERQGRYSDLRVQILKNRDGAISNDIASRIDYATSYFARPAAGDFGSLIEARTEVSGLAGLLG